GLGTPRQRQWHSVPRVTAPERGTTNRTPRRTSGGPSVLAFVIVACRGPSRQRRGRTTSRGRARRARTSGARHVGHRIRSLRPGLVVATLVERGLAAIASGLESDWAATMPPMAHG